MRYKDLPQQSGTRTMSYAGIGARNTPAHILEKMEQIATCLEYHGYTLRSGGAVGADSAFERGCQSQEIFHASDATDDTRRIAKLLHPAPERLQGYVLDLMARNTFQVFGSQLNSPVDFVVCWTPDGCEHHSDRSRQTGGTGQAISLASLKGIPVLNLANDTWRDRIIELISQ